MQPIRYAILYRTGGTANFRWCRVFGIFTADEAEAKRAELERMGYPTCLAATTSILAHRVPEQEIAR